jgi:hypothetical protein
MMASYFVWMSSVFMLNFVSPSTFMRRFTCSIRDDIEEVPYRQGWRWLSPFLFFHLRRF